jgi:DNA repair exonuclease SbcCD ATPase subunit
MTKKYKIRINKPNAGYPGSLLQQNFGEQETKGYLTWDIKNKSNWDVCFNVLENEQPFITIEWKGSVFDTIGDFEKQRGDRAFLPGARYRISSASSIPSIEARKLMYELKDVRKASEVAFKYDISSRMEHITTDTAKISKKGLRQDPDAVVNLYRDYIAAHKENYNFDNEKMQQAENLIRSYMNRLSLAEVDNLTTGTTWSVKSFNFDNLYRYGEGNSINFNNLEGIVGIFAPNKTGKSSIIGSLMYTLYNTSDRGSLKTAHIINKNKNWAKGEIRITVGGDDYIIERQATRVVSKKSSAKDDEKTTTTLNLYKVEWDDETGAEKKVVKNSISRDETDKVIRRLIGSSNDFLLTSLSSQGQVDNFIKEGATERKNILSRFLELDIFKNLEDLVKKDYNSAEARSNYLSAESLLTQITRTRKEITSTEQDIAELDEKNDKLLSQKDEIKLWLMHHEKSAAEVDMIEISNLEKTINDGEKTLKEKQEKLIRLEEEAKSKQERLAEIKQNKQQIDVKVLKKQLDELEVVKGKVAELRQELSSQESKLTTQKKNVKKLDVVPCGDQFPNCHYIKDAHKDKKQLEKQESLVSALASKLTEHQFVLNDYVQKKIKETIVLWQELDREEFELNSTLGSNQKHREFLKGEIKTIKNVIKSNKDDFAQLKKRVNLIEGKEYESKKQQLEKVQSKLLEVQTAKQSSLVNLGGKKERMTTLLLEQEETKNLIEKLKIYDSIQSAFSKTGIPSMVLKSQLPAINLELGKILTGVADFKIFLETDINSNTMDVYIEDGHSKRIIELASGMEKTIASIALRVALTNLSSLPKSDILIIDEGFSALDEDNTVGCMEMLTFLRSYFKTILIISHVPQIKESADKIIEIKNEGSDSFIEVN